MRLLKKTKIALLAVQFVTAVLILITAGLALAASEQLPQWSYSGDNGPESWGSLTIDGIHFPYSTCSAGQEQSPIDLSNATYQRTGELETIYTSWSLNVENNGHTIQVNVAPGSTLTIKDKKYYLLQYHFHASSEHTVNDQHEPLEIHFVHMNSRGELAVIGVFVKESHDGLDNKQIAKILELAPHSVGKTAVENNAIKTNELLSTNNIKNFWYYNGSLTTPPCSEGVNWYVSQNHIHASHQQILELEELVHHNFRPTQFLNDRDLYTSDK